MADRVGNRDFQAFKESWMEKRSGLAACLSVITGSRKRGWCPSGRAKRAICMEGRDFYDALERSIPLREVLERKVRYAAEKRVSVRYGRTALRFEGELRALKETGSKRAC